MILSFKNCKYIDIPFIIKQPSINVIPNLLLIISHEKIGEKRCQRRAHWNPINLIIHVFIKEKIGWTCGKLKKFCKSYLNYIKCQTLPAFRPTLSSTGTYNYELAKFLGKLLDDVIPNDHSTTDTFSFVEELKTVSVANKCMVSYDVTSLFTNIPLEEIIEI